MLGNGPTLIWTQGGRRKGSAQGPDHRSGAASPETSPSWAATPLGTRAHGQAVLTTACPAAVVPVAPLTRRRTFTVRSHLRPGQRQERVRVLQEDGVPADEVVAAADGGAKGSGKLGGKAGGKAGALCRHAGPPGSQICLGSSWGAWGCEQPVCAMRGGRRWAGTWCLPAQARRDPRFLFGWSWRKRSLSITQTHGIAPQRDLAPFRLHWCGTMHSEQVVARRESPSQSATVAVLVSGTVQPNHERAFIHMLCRQSPEGTACSKWTPCPPQRGQTRAQAAGQQDGQQGRRCPQVWVQASTRAQAAGQATQAEQQAAQGPQSIWQSLICLQVCGQKFELRCKWCVR